MDNICKKLDDCIEKHLDNMAALDVGSEDMAHAIDDMTRLYKLRIEEKKLDAETSNNNANRTLEKDKVANDKSFKESQLKLEERKIDVNTNIESSKLDADKQFKNEQLKLEEDKLKLEDRKVELDHSYRVTNLSLDKDKFAFDKGVAKKQFSEHTKDRYFDLGISAAGIVLPMALYAVLAFFGYAREFDGVITSDTLKRVLNSVKLGKK